MFLTKKSDSLIILLYNITFNSLSYVTYVTYNIINIIPIIFLLNYISIYTVISSMPLFNYQDKSFLMFQNI